MTVEQKFNSHLVPEIHRVRQATSAFKYFAIIWWTELGNIGLQPDTWERLKVAMCTYLSLRLNVICIRNCSV
jgi:hypothetical protein